MPITYLSVNDFLNLAVQLRSVPELKEYLSARRSLSQTDLRLIDDEEALFSFYLLNDGSFADCTGRSEARVAVATSAAGSLYNESTKQAGTLTCWNMWPTSSLA